MISSRSQTCAPVSAVTCRGLCVRPGLCAPECPLCASSCRRPSRSPPPGSPRPALCLCGRCLSAEPVPCGPVSGVSPAASCSWGSPTSWQVSVALIPFVTVTALWAERPPSVGPTPMRSWLCVLLACTRTARPRLSNTVWPPAGCQAVPSPTCGLPPASVSLSDPRDGRTGGGVRPSPDPGAVPVLLPIPSSPGSPERGCGRRLLCLGPETCPGDRPASLEGGQGPAGLRI